MKLPEKGTFGYFDKKKKLTLTATILSFLLVAAIYVAGILIYHTNRSVLTVMAALAVLPAAKICISFLVIAPYRSVLPEQYEELCALIGQRGDCKILCDILLASEQKSMLAGIIAIVGGHILMYSGSEKTDAATLENYIKKILENCSYSSVKLYTEYGLFKKRIEQLQGEETEENICEQIEKNILIYTI